jgi:hypothetical protein
MTRLPRIAIGIGDLAGVEIARKALVHEALAVHRAAGKIAMEDEPAGILHGSASWFGSGDSR